jgi:hypothetical protein
VNSITLKESGFSQPCSIKTVSFSILPSTNGTVFAIIDTSLTGKAATDILYIGRTKKLSKRILGGYLAGYGGKNTKKINATLLGEGYIEKTAISWMSCDKPKTMQKELLGKYTTEHGKTPLWNASKKKPEKIKKVATAKTRSSAAISSKVAKTEKKPAASPKVNTPVKHDSAKSTIPSKVTTPQKPTETSSSPSSIRTSTDSAQKPA